MDSNKYSLTESLERIDRFLKGYNVIPEDIAGTKPLRKYPVVVSKKYTLLLAKIDLNFGNKENEKPEGVYGAVYNELTEIAGNIEQCQCVSIVGDKLFAVYDTRMKSDVNDVIDVAASMCGIIDIINYKCSGFKNNRVKINISICYGMMDFLSYGDLRYNAIGDRQLIEDTELQLDVTGTRVVISRIIYNNMKDDYKALFKTEGFDWPCTGNIINTGMSNWLANQKK
jgi:hypothetical protein